MAKQPKSHEGEEFSADQFCEMFKTSADTSLRLKAERRANRKKPAKRAVRTAVVNFRTTGADKDLAHRLAKELGLSVGKAYDQAMRALAEKHGLEIKE